MNEYVLFPGDFFINSHRSSLRIPNLFLTNISSFKSTLLWVIIRPGPWEHKKETTQIPSSLLKIIFAKGVNLCTALIFTLPRPRPGRYKTLDITPMKTKDQSSQKEFYNDLFMSLLFLYVTPFVTLCNFFFFMSLAI